MTNHETEQIQRLQHHNCKTSTITTPIISITKFQKHRPNRPHNFDSKLPTKLNSTHNNPTTNMDDTYEQIIEQPHTNSFRSQNNHLFSPR